MEKPEASPHRVHSPFPAQEWYPEYQDRTVFLQSDTEAEDVNVELKDTDGFASDALVSLGTDGEERQVHVGVAHFHQDVGAQVQDRMAVAIEAHDMGVL